MACHIRRETSGFGASLDTASHVPTTGIGRTAGEDTTTSASSVVGKKKQVYS